MNAFRTFLCCALLAGLARAETFYPVTLADCYQRTLAQNAEIQKARLDLERAAGTKLVFASRALPRLKTQTQAGASLGPLYNDQIAPFAMVGANAAQPLLDTGIPASWRRGKLEVLLAEQNLHRITSEQLHAVRLAYWRTALARDLAQIQREITARLAANVQREQEKFDVGQVGRQAVRQAEIQSLNLQQDVAMTERGQLAAATDLALLIGETVATGGVVRLPLPDEKLKFTPLTVDVAAASERAVAERPDLRWLRELIRATREDQRVIESGFFPFITLAASGQYVPKSEVYQKYPQTVPNRDPRATEALYGATWTWRVLDNGALIGARRRVAASREAMELVLQQLEANVPRELTVLAGTAAMAAAKMTALRASEKQAGELLQLAEQRVVLGEATQLDFRNAQANLLSTQAGLAQAAFENEWVRAELDRLTGRYLDLQLKTTP